MTPDESDSLRATILRRGLLAIPVVLPRPDRVAVTWRAS